VNRRVGVTVGAAGGTATVAPAPSGRRGGRGRVPVGEERYLWLLVACELAAIAALRHTFRGAHGG
jgi:hypothetical protein